MRRVVLFIMLLFAIPLVAQEDDPARMVFQPLEVTNVRLQLADDGAIALQFNASPAVCEELLVDIRVDDGFIDINALAPHTDAVCNTLVPYEPIIALPEIATDQAYVLFLNDFASTFYLPAQDDGQSTEPFAVAWGRDNTLVGFDMVQPLIDSIDYFPTGQNVTVRLAGNQPDGCISEEFLRVWQDDVQSNLIHVDSFRLLPQGVMCPAELIAFESVAELPYAEDTLIEVDGNYVRLTDSEPIEVTPSPISLDSVEILETANGAIVVVTGDEGVTCGENVQTYQQQRDYATLIDIVSYRNSADDCTNDLSTFERTLIGVVLPVIINGIGYDEDGEFAPNMLAQSDDTPSGGNFMVSDTVIEDVEVAILESFPMQLQLTVSGFQPDGCDFPVEVQQVVNGNDVTLHIFRNVPPDAICPMMLIPYEETILVDGSFEGGTVTIQANEFTLQVEL